MSERDSVAERLLTPLEAAVEAIQGARRVTAICHENPDADTIGAAVAVALVAGRLGKQSEIVSSDRPPLMYDFLAGIRDVVPRPRLEPDLAVICDAATIERVGRVATEQAEWLANARILNIDHHVSNTGFGDINLVEPRAAATCEVLAKLVGALGLQPDAALATALLTGIVRDSHGFSDPATSGDTLRVAADLVDCGAPLAFIQQRILADLPFRTMALWGRILGTLGQAAEGRIVHANLQPDMLAATGTEQQDADGLVEFLARSRDGAVTILARDLGAAGTRISIRSVAPVDATVIAAAFGGGGHARRAGCTVPLPVYEALEQVVEVAAGQLPAPAAPEQ
jgi:phosphoesterase RecJ-like protein